MVEIQKHGFGFNMFLSSNFLPKYMIAKKVGKKRNDGRRPYNKLFEGK